MTPDRISDLDSIDNSWEDNLTEEQIFKSRTKKKAKTKQNQAWNGKDKVKG
ncbi:hypothetical protein Tco_0948720, partial [Tanacetum coccineum]